MRETEKPSTKIYSKEQKAGTRLQILLVDPGQILQRQIRTLLETDAYLSQCDLLEAQEAEDVLGHLAYGTVALLLVADQKAHPWLELLQKSAAMAPQTTRLLAIKNWQDQDLRQTVNQGQIYRALSLPMEKTSLLEALRSGLVEHDLLRTRQRLLREAARQNKELELLNQDLEKMVEERTLHIRQSKEEEDEKLNQLRQLIRFVKDLSLLSSFDEILQLVRQEIRRFSRLGEPLLIWRGRDLECEILYFRSGQVIRHVSNFSLPPSEQIQLNDVKLSQILANQLGRPLIKTLFFPIEVPATQKVGALQAQAVLCIESAKNDYEQATFLDFMLERIRALSMAVDRTMLESEMTNFSFRWERTFDGIRDPIAIVDVNYEVLRANKKFSDKILRQKCYVAFAHRSEPCVGCPLQNTLISQTTQAQQIEAEGKIYKVYSYPIRLEKEGRLTNVVHQYVDVTQARELYIKMLQSEKMGAIGLLAGHIAHELNNPLTGLRSLAQVMISQVNGEPQLKSDLEEVEKAAARSQGIIRNLLEFSQGGPTSLKDISLDEVVRRTMPLLKTMLRPHRFQLDLKTENYLVHADPQMLQQVVFNLINNACQAMLEGGSLTVSTELGPENKTVRLLIEDSGPGIPLELQERIFEPFFTTKTEGHGTGLGLSLSRDFIRGFKGNIFVRSLPGQGSTFIVELPIVRKEP